jgi:hypothetical protein
LLAAPQNETVRDPAVTYLVSRRPRGLTALGHAIERNDRHRDPGGLALTLSIVRPRRMEVEMTCTQPLRPERYG